MSAVPENFYQFETQDENDLFGQMGAAFGEYSRSVLEAERTDPEWPKKMARATHLLDFTSTQFPEYIAQLERYAEAAGIPFLDLWTMSLEDDAEDEEKTGDHCTSLVTNNGNLIGQIEDWNLNSAHKVCLVQTRIRDQLSLQLYYINTLGGSSITVAHGRVHMVDSVRHLQAAGGIPKNVVARHLTDAKSTTGGLSRLAKINAVSGYAFTVVAQNGQIFSIETAPGEVESQTIQPPFVHTNHYLHPNFRSIDRGSPRTNSKGRFQQATALLKPEMSVDELKALMSDVSQGPDNSLFNRRTVGRMIVDREHKTAHVSLARNGDGNSWFLADLSEML